jgi:pentatricopeptide repeat protein
MPGAPARAPHTPAAVSGLAEDPFVASSLLHTYLCLGAPGDTRSMFDRMPEKSVVSWSALITAYSARGDTEAAWGLLEEMRSASVEPNVITWYGLASGLNRRGRALDAVTALVRMQREGFSPDATGVSCALSAVGMSKRSWSASRCTHTC